MLKTYNFQTKSAEIAPDFPDVRCFLRFLSQDCCGAIEEGPAAFSFNIVFDSKNTKVYSNVDIKTVPANQVDIGKRGYERGIESTTFDLDDIFFKNEHLYFVNDILTIKVEGTVTIWKKTCLDYNVSFIIQILKMFMHILDHSASHFCYLVNFRCRLAFIIENSPCSWSPMRFISIFFSKVFRKLYSTLGDD